MIIKKKFVKNIMKSIKNIWFDFDKKIILEILEEIFNVNHQIIYDNDILEIYNSIQYFKNYIVPKFCCENNNDYYCFKFKVFEFNWNIDIKYLKIIKNNNKS